MNCGKFLIVIALGVGLPFISCEGVQSKGEVAQTEGEKSEVPPMHISSEFEGAIFLDYKQPIEKRVQDLISILSLKEKVILLNHRGPEIERLKIKSDGWNQSMHGVWWDRPTTLFPVPIAMAATWDTTTVNKVASAISDEARGIYNGWHNDADFLGKKMGLIYRAPILNIARNPYWGRNYEIWGEDPFLTGRMGVSFVHGLQGGADPEYLKLAATLKHYAVNNVEEERRLLSATVGERMLHEYWLPAFKDVIIEGNAQSVMASYNAINGVPNVMNEHLLTDILKDRWGFEGFVVSDLGGVGDLIDDWGNYNYGVQGIITPVEGVARAINAGTDFSEEEFMEYLGDAVRQGLVSEERLNDALSRVLRVRFKLGEFDPAEIVPYSDISPDVIGSAEHRQLALETAQKSMVLLTNRNDYLPLDKGNISTIAVIGPHANRFMPGGYTGEYKNAVTPLQGIKSRAAPGTEILHAIGGEIVPPTTREDVYINKEEELINAVEVAKKADVAIVYVGTSSEIESEGDDRKMLGLPGNQLELVKKVYAANPNTVVVLINAGPMTIPWIKENVPAIIEGWIGGEEGGNAIADVIFGNVNPGGKLPFTVYASEDQVPPQDEYEITEGFTYMYLNGEPLFPFGHGLSYTDFEYSNLEISPQNAPKDGEITVSVTVENIGERAGHEVVQLYAHDRESSVIQPAKELIGFSRINLSSGEKSRVTFAVPMEKLSFYDEKTQRFLVEAGSFDIMVGSSSGDIREEGIFTLN